MSQLIKPLILSPATKSPLRRCITSIFTSNLSTGGFKHRQFITTTAPPLFIHRKNLHVSRSRGLRPADAPSSSELENEANSSESEGRSRNKKKREARRSFRWAMELANFNDVQIKRILRMASLEENVFDALMLVKRLGRDVREGKRRQFSYIGRLLREHDVDPELMDKMIQATKDGDQQKFLELSSASNKSDLGNTLEEEEETDYEDETEEEEFGDYHDVATRWFDGLVNKDIDITNEIYSLSTVDFDRQELRKLVRNFCSINDKSDTNEGETNVGLLKAKKHLTRFLVSLAKQLPSEEENYIL